MGERYDIGTGLYTPQEAAGMMPGLSASRIARWTRGTQYRDRTGTCRTVEPIVRRPGAAAGDTLLTFRELIEVHLVHLFLRAGVSFQEVRLASSILAERLGSEHPFVYRRLRTDGKRIFADLEEGTLETLRNGQLVFTDVIAPYLRNLDYDPDDYACRWYPLGRERSVVVDPRRAFGQPTTTRGIPTSVLAGDVAAGQSVADVAWCYDVPESVVRDALTFERQTMGAAA